MPVIATNEEEKVYPCKCRHWEHRDPKSGVWHQPLTGCDTCGGWYFDKDFVPKVSLTKHRKKK